MIAMSPLSLVDISCLRDHIYRSGDAHPRAEEAGSPALNASPMDPVEPLAGLSILTGIACASVLTCFGMLASMHLLLDY